MSSAYHPQTDGQSERTNQWVEQYLRIYINHAQDNWASLLPLAQYVHNSWPSATTGLTPFDLLIGFTPSMGAERSPTGSLPALKDRREALTRLRAQAVQSILHAQKLLLMRNKKDKRKAAFSPFSLGDKVWLEGTNLRLAYPSKKLAPRRYGPFRITKVISPVVYQLELPANWKIFPTFHASLLSPYRETMEHGANYLEPPLDVIQGEEEYEVEEILDQWSYGHTKKKQYLIKWKGYSPAHNSWEDASGVHAPILVDAFLKARTKKTHINNIKARLGLSSPAMQSASSAPSLSSLELYSLDHFLWYDGSTHTTPSPQEGDIPEGQEAHHLTDDDDSVHQTFHTAASAPTTPNTGGSCAADATCPEADPHPRCLWDATMAHRTQDQDEGGASLTLPQQAPSRDQLSLLSFLDVVHGLGSSLGGSDSHSEQPSASPQGSSLSRGVDGELLVLEGGASVTSSSPSFITLFNYSPYSHNTGEVLQEPADFTRD